MFASLAHIRTSHHICFILCLYVCITGAHQGLSSYLFLCLYVRITGAHQGLSSYLFLSLSLCSHHWCTSGPLIIIVSFLVSMFASLAHIRASHHNCFFPCLYVRITGAHQGLSSYLFLSLSLCSHHWRTSGPLIIIVSFLVSMFASLAHIRTSHHNCFFPCLYVRITGAHQGLSSYLFLSLSLCSYHWRTSGPLIIFVSFLVSMFASLAHIRASHHVCFFPCLYVRITGAHQVLSSYVSFLVSMFASLAHIRASHHNYFFPCLYVRITGAHQGLSS